MCIMLLHNALEMNSLVPMMKMCVDHIIAVINWSITEDEDLNVLYSIYF